MLIKTVKRESKTRVEYFDTLRFLAAMLIFVTHFIATFYPEYFNFFTNGPTSLLLGGLSGKLGVAMLCVILGYFAYRKAESSLESVLILFVKRYFHFIVTAFVFYIIAWIVQYRSFGGPRGLWTIIKESVMLHYGYNLLFWSLMPLLIGSGVCYCLGKCHADMRTCVLAVILCILFRNEWVAGCAAGAVLYKIEQDGQCIEWLKERTWARLLLFIISLPLIYRGGVENFTIYLLDDLFCFIFVLITMSSKPLARLMGARIFKSVNRSYFGVYILHQMVYELTGGFFLELFAPYLLHRYTFLFSFLITAILTIVLSQPVVWIIGKADKIFANCLSRICDYVGVLIGRINMNETKR